MKLDSDHHLEDSASSFTLIRKTEATTNSLVARTLVRDKDTMLLMMGKETQCSLERKT